MGQASAVEVEWSGEEIPKLPQLREDFETRYQQIFGYRYPQGHGLEVVMVRVIASEKQESGEQEGFGGAQPVLGLIEADYCTILAGGRLALPQGRWRESSLREGDH